MSLLEDVLVGTDKITPVDYGILAEVEAATLLWQIDQDRALVMLKSACETMRELLEKDPDRSIHRKHRRLRFLAFIKIARLMPELVQDLALNKANDDNSALTVSGDWSEEARAVITIADEQIEKNPALAAHLMQQTLSLGQVDWAVFLRKLSARDSRLSEQLAMTVIDRLGSSSITPIYLLNFRRFVFTPERSAQLKEHFFKSLAIRLRRDINPAVSTAEVNDDLVTTQDALRMAAGYARWQAEFVDIYSALQELMKARSAFPDLRNNKTIRISMMDEIKPGETQEIQEGLPRVDRIRESKARDAKYREMATKAALNSDIRLAEEIISKIEDEAIRVDTATNVYSPYVRKAIGQSDWTGARDYASKMVDPLGRTLVLERIAQGMSKSGKDKQSVKDVFSFAIDRLRRDAPSEDVGRAFLILAKSLSVVDAESSVDAAGWAIHILNKVTRNGEPLGDFKVGSALAWWINVPTFSLQDEVLDLTEMIGTLFKEMAKRDLKTAQSIAHGFAHHGLYSLAQLGIVRSLLESAGDPKRVADRQQTPARSPQQ